MNWKELIGNNSIPLMEFGMRLAFYGTKMSVIKKFRRFLWVKRNI